MYDTQLTRGEYDALRERYEAIMDYAQSFDGYTYAKEVWETDHYPDKLDEVKQAGWVSDSKDELRACLFLKQRAEIPHFPHDATSVN